MGRENDALDGVQELEETKRERWNMEGYNEFYGQRPKFPENPGIPVKN